jgi:hypothetical protein
MLMKEKILFILSNNIEGQQLTKEKSATSAKVRTAWKIIRDSGLMKEKRKDHTALEIETVANRIFENLAKEKGHARAALRI